MCVEGMQCWGHVWQMGVHGRGCEWQGPCMKGAMCGRGHAWLGIHAGETATDSGGTYPTGMHSFNIFLLARILKTVGINS